MKRILTLAVLALIVYPGCVFRLGQRQAPGRNESGVGWRSTTDVFVYTDTGELNKPEDSFIGWEIRKAAPEPEIPQPDIQAPDPKDSDPDLDPALDPK